MSTKIKIMLAEDKSLFRTALTSMLKDYEFEISGQASNGKELLSLLKYVKNDVVLMDIEMPEMNGIEALKIIQVRFPAVKVIMLSIHKDVYYIKEAVALGAKGYISKNCTPEQLVNCIIAVHGNQRFFEDALIREIAFDALSSNQAPQSSKSSLSNREKEVLKALCSGKTEKEIALMLNISHHTVHFHRMKLHVKTKSHNLADLMRYAYNKLL